MGDEALHRIPYKGAVTLRSSFVATLIALLFVFLLGGFPDSSSQLPESTQSPTSSPNIASESDTSTEASEPSATDAGSADVREIAAAPLAGRTVVLDAGHGGTDPGALGVSGRTREAYNTLFVALDAKNMLEQAGAHVVMTRSDDRFVPLATRAALANRAGADIFISIHNDSNPNPSVRGVTTYYYHDRSRHLAETMQTHLVRTLSARDVGVRRQSFQVLRETRMPSVLLELGFLSNWTDEQLLADPGYRYRAARAIYDGVVDYFSNEG